VLESQPANLVCDRRFPARHELRRGRE
jgi:hypothetical protein